MAFKCWKKTLDETYLVHFYNEKTEKILRLESVFVNNAPNEWQIRKGSYPSFITAKLIRHGVKSKAQAMKFAKTYMRKNDRC